MSEDSEVRVSFKLQSLSAFWNVSHASVRERMNEPYAISLTLTTSELGTDPVDLLGIRAILTLERGVLVRTFHGVVSEVSLGDESRGDAHGRSCHVLVVPALAMLGARRDTRIFQEMTVPDILKAVLEPLGDYDATFEVKTQRTYPVCEYRTQYDETDLEFVHRLMGEEGMFYFFEHEDDAEHLMITDDIATYSALESTDGDSLRFVSADGVGRDEVVSVIHRADSMQSTRLAVRQFDWTRPDVAIDGTTAPAPSSAPAGSRVGPVREVYEQDAEPVTMHSYSAGNLAYGGDDLTDQLALRRHAHLQSAQTFGGSSTAVGLRPAKTFVLTDHPNQNLRIEYVTVGTQHDIYVGDSVGDTSAFGLPRPATYTNNFSALPSTMSYRAMRRRKHPVPGIMTATVVGPSGSEIYTDEHGRVKLQFHWDRKGKRDERSSCFVRVMQAWAGAGWGTWFLPRVGMEAVVSFIDGDPDRPVVTGTLYNGNQRPPFPQPAESTRSGIRTNSSLTTGGYNELRFEDAANAEEVFLQAQKDLNELVKNNHFTQVIGDQSNVVAGNHTVVIGMDRSVTVGASETIAIGSSRTETVGGAETIRLGDIRDTEITKSDKLLVHETRDEEIEGAFTGKYLAGRTIQVEQGDTETVVASDKAVMVEGAYEIEVDTHFRVKRAGSEVFVEDIVSAESPTKVELIVGGNSLAISSDGKIVMTSTAQLELVCGSASLMLKSDGTIQASGSTKIELASGSSVTKLEPAGVATQATQVDLEGSSMVNVKGGMVNLN